MFRYRSDLVHSLAAVGASGIIKVLVQAVLLVLEVFLEPRADNVIVRSLLYGS